MTVIFDQLKLYIFNKLRYLSKWIYERTFQTVIYIYANDTYQTRIRFLEITRSWFRCTSHIHINCKYCYSYLVTLVAGLKSPNFIQVLSDNLYKSYTKCTIPYLKHRMWGPKSWQTVFGFKYSQHWTTFKAI